MNLPKAKTENIVVQDLKDELLVYNLTTHQAFTLNETLKIVYSACDGQTTFADLKRSFKFTDDFVHLALDELHRNNLLTDYAPGNHFAGLSRREAIKKVGLASMVALPVISALIAPQAAHAVSLTGNGGQCAGNGVCQSGCCGASAPGAQNQTCVNQGAKSTGYCRGVCECVGGCCIGNLCQANTVATNQSCSNSCQCPPSNSCINSTCQPVVP